MQLGMIGVGRMGGNMVRRLIRAGHQVIVYSARAESREKFAKETGKLRLVTLDDWDFNDKQDEHGNSIYNFVKIPSKTYPSLQKGWFWGRDVETLAVTAVLVLRNDWVKQYDANALDALSLAVARAGGKIYRQVDGLK